MPSCRLFACVSFAVCSTLSSAAEPGSLTELMDQLPRGASAMVVLPKGQGSADALAAAVKRLSREPNSLWPRVLLGLSAEQAKAVEPAAPAALLAHPASDAADAAVWRVRLVRLRAGSDPLMGLAEAAPTSWRRLDGTADKPIARVHSGWLIVADSAEAATWWESTAGQRLGEAEAAEAPDATLIVRVSRAATHLDDEGRAIASPAWDQLPHAEALKSAIGRLDQTLGGAVTLTGYLRLDEAGLRPRLVAVYDPNTDAGRYIAELAGQAPRADPFAGLALGTPALLVSAELSPTAGRRGIAPLAAALSQRLRREEPKLAADFDAKLSALAEKSAESVRGVSLAIGLPSGGSGVVGVQGALTLAPSAKLGPLLAELAPVLNQFLAVMGQRFALPMSFAHAANGRKLGERSVDVLEAAIGGEGIAANTARGLLSAVLGREGARVLLAEWGEARVAWALAENAALLERTLAGGGTGLKPDSREARSLAALPGPRHATILVSPGRLLTLGRRVQQNAFRLPEWKPTGFLAVAVRLSGSTVRVDVDAPWEEAEAVGAYLVSRESR